MKQFIKTAMIFMVLVALMLSLSGCTSPTVTPTPTPTPEPQGPVVLTITGKVDKPLSLTMVELKKYENKDITVPGKDNKTDAFSGVSFNKVLDALGLKSDATIVHLYGSDGYNKTIEITTIRTTTDAIIAINTDNSLKAIFPGQSKGAWVGNLTSIVIE